MDTSEVKLVEEKDNSSQNKKLLNESDSNSNNNSGKQKRKFKMPSSLVIILGIIVFVTVLTWIFSGKDVSYDPEVDQGTVSMVGLLAIPSHIIQGFGNAAGIIFYLFVLGWFLETVLRSGALESGVKSLIRGLNGKEIVLVPLMFTLFAIGGTTFGMQEETISLYIIIIPFFLLAGFDTMTGLLIILLGTTTGFASSVVNPFSVGAAATAANDAINASMVTDGVTYIAIGDGMIARMIIFIILTTIGACFVTFYASKVRSNKDLSLTKETREADEEWANEVFDFSDVDKSKMSKLQMWTLIIFGLTFLVMFLGLFPWFTFINDGAGLTRPDSNGVNWIIGNGSSLGDDGLWSNNQVYTFGAWDYGGLMLLFGIGTIVISLINKNKGSDIMDAFWTGAKDMLSVAVIIGVARAIPSIMGASHLDLFFANSIAQALGDNVSTWGFSYVMFFVFFGFGLLIPSTSGLASATMGVFASTILQIFGNGTWTEDAANMLIVTIIVYSIVIGLVNMFIPTQAVVMLSCERARVPYGQALKPIGIYMGIQIAVTLLIIIPLLQVAIIG